MCLLATCWVWSGLHQDFVRQDFVQQDSEGPRPPRQTATGTGTGTGNQARRDPHSAHPHRRTPRPVSRLGARSDRGDNAADLDRVAGTAVWGRPRTLGWEVRLAATGLDYWNTRGPVTSYRRTYYAPGYRYGADAAPGRAASPRCVAACGVPRRRPRSRCRVRRGGGPRRASRTSCRRPVPRRARSEACRVPCSRLWVRMRSGRSRLSALEAVPHAGFCDEVAGVGGIRFQFAP